MIHQDLGLSVQGFILLVCVVVVFIWMLRRLRASEVEAFLDEKMPTLDSLASKIEPAEDDPILLRAQAFLQRQAEIEETVDMISEPAIKYDLKRSVLDEPYRNLLFKMLDELGSDYRILVNLPVSDFVTGRPDELQGKTLSFLICDQDYLSIIAGVEFQKAGDGDDRLEFLRGVFRDINRQLILFPMLNQFSSAEVEEKLAFLKTPEFIRSVRFPHEPGNESFP